MPVFQILCYTGITLVRPGGNREMTRAKRWAAVLLTLALLAGGGVFLSLDAGSVLGRRPCGRFETGVVSGS